MALTKMGKDARPRTARPKLKQRGPREGKQMWKKTVKPVGEDQGVQIVENSDEESLTLGGREHNLCWAAGSEKKEGKSRARRVGTRIRKSPASVV